MAISQFDDTKKRLRTLVLNRLLVGLANDTKWNELVKACIAMDWNGPIFRYKCIDNDYVSDPWFEWESIPYPTLAIEWLDIFYLENQKQHALLPSKIIDHSFEIESILNDIGLDYKKGKNCFRIFGYAPRNEDGFIDANTNDKYNA